MLYCTKLVVTVIVISWANILFNYLMTEIKMQTWTFYHKGKEK